MTTEELAQLRLDVIAATPPYAGRPEYAVTDPSFLDPCITGARGRDRAEIIQRASVCVANRLTERDGLAAIAARIAERYAHPVITRDGDRVRIDAGVVEGSLMVYKARVMVDQSPYLDGDREWTTAEIVRCLELGIAHAPDARYYQAEIEIPAQWTGPEWTYVYDRVEDRIRAYAKHWWNIVYVSEKLGGNVRAVRSLNHRSLTQESSREVPVRTPKIRADNPVVSRG